MQGYASHGLSAVEVVDRLIQTAVAQRVSDIHIEPTQREFVVRFRIDGVLHTQEPIPLEIGQQVVGRIKVLACIDTAEHRSPQDGKIVVASDHGNIDLRISTFPSLYGQKVVMRILDRDQTFLQLDQIGLPTYILEHIQAIISKPQGFFLVTGPTGSGKTTTLYAVLAQLNKSERNIVTLEDPVEYSIDGITQGHINERVGFDFAQGIRAILRQDPDVIMVGEIRDKHTARAAIQAALTGHLVFSTLHTNDAPSSISRLVHMGVEPYLINAALSGVLAQRLVRRLCPCSRMRKIQEHERTFFGDMSIPEKIHAPNGCQACCHIGYRGRIGIFEFMRLDDELRTLIARNSRPEAVAQLARTCGYENLVHDAYNKLIRSEISLTEFLSTRQ